MSKNNQPTSVAPTDMAAVETATENQAKIINPVPQRAAVVMSGQKPTKSQATEEFEKLCDAFIAVKTGDKADKKINGRILKYAQRSIAAFGKMMNFIYAHQDDQGVLSAYQRFMSQHNGDYMSSTEALQGMNFVNSELERNRYAIMYMLMYELVNPTRSRIDYNYERATRYCSNPNCPVPNGLVQYVAARMR